MEYTITGTFKNKTVFYNVDTDDLVDDINKSSIFFTSDKAIFYMLWGATNWMSNKYGLRITRV
jgi:hypothetical protein